MTKPNILVFMVDQLTSFVLASYGGTVCKTPNLDALAARGTVFDTAYCPYPLCLPSRYGLMTGRLPSRIGAYDNGAELAAATPTFAHHLRAAGYYTCLSGKMHFVGPDQLHGFEDRLTTEIYPADMSWTPAPAFRDQGQGENAGLAFGVSTLETVKDAGPVALSMQIDYDEEVVHQATRALFARARGEDRRPFLLTVSLTQPHDPYVTTEDFWERHAETEIEPPRVPHIPVEARDPHSRSLYYHYSQDKCALDARDYRRARRGYYGMIANIDAYLGRVLEVLETCGFAENTIVLFTSDHGDMIGERGMWFKKTLYDPAIQVPLIIACPERTRARVATPVSLLDIFPTLLEFAGVEAGTARLDGRSLVPALTGDLPTVPLFVEHIDGGTAAPRVCVREGAWKLVLSRAYPPMLFDLESDPLELGDLAGRGLDVEDRLTALAEDTWDLDRLKTEVEASQAERRLVDQALQQGRIAPWDHPASPLETYVRRGDTFPEVERRRYLAARRD